MVEAEDHYWKACRCGEQYKIFDYQLEVGVEVVPCTGCSLRIHVSYVAQDDDDE